jgi:hypothetical protein
MKIQRTVALVLVLAVALVLSPALGHAQKKAKKKEAEAPQEKVFIPKPVQAVIEEGLESREGRRDIAIDAFQYYVFPARENLHTIVLFKAKNGELGFIPAEGPEGTLEARFNVFLQFRQMDNGRPAGVAREVFIPAVLQENAETFDPETEAWYSAGYPLPPGNYLLGLAVTSLDLERIGIDYMEIALPNPAIQNALDTTPILFVGTMEQMPAVEMRAELHKEYFTYSVLKMTPNVERVIAPGQDVEIFFFIFGARPVDQQKVSLEIGYEVMKGEETQIRWEAQSYEIPLISQPLPMKQTVIITDESGERTEQRNLEPGSYTLVLTIKDTLAGNTLEKTIPFEVKE